MLLRVTMVLVLSKRASIPLPLPEAAQANSSPGDAAGRQSASFRFVSHPPFSSLRNAAAQQRPTQRAGWAKRVIVRYSKAVCKARDDVRANMTTSSTMRLYISFASRPRGLAEPVRRVAAYGRGPVLNA